ncbi:hypothetical protein JB92DRAFT_3021605 [Gautieria morchelliformis]|nr:hypothetical protein JB92DRAFT_3021605 [Gautieria morchelliformis]
MSIKKLKVRPRKVPPPNPCAVELGAMLGCWASTGDFTSTSGCADVAKVLHQCMRTQPMRSRAHQPTINYHLARLRTLSKS